MNMERFNIKAVVKFSGVNAHTLRAWERRYQVIKPSREPNGRRLYSLKDAERLKLLAALVGEGHAISHLSKLTDEDLRSLVARSTGTRTPITESPRGRLRLLTDPTGIQKTSTRVLNVLSDYRLDRLHQELTRAQLQLSARSFVLDVALPLLTQVGAMVRNGKMAMAQEDALLAVLRVHLFEIMETMRAEVAPINDAHGREVQVALATRDGEIHEFGIMLAAVLCMARGIRYQYLGANLPSASLSEAVKAIGSTVVLIGCTSMPARAMKALERNDFVADLDRYLPAGVEIWVGGGDQDSRSSLSGRSASWFRTLPEFDRRLAEIDGSAPSQR